MAYRVGATFRKEMLVRRKEEDKSGRICVYAFCCPFNDLSFFRGELFFIEEVGNKTSCSLCAFRCGAIERVHKKHHLLFDVVEWHI
jgi:hypothetical protein